MCSSCRNRLSQLDFSKDTPHNSTHPYTTFDHSSVLVDDLIKFADAHPETVWCLVANGKLHTELENDRIWEVNGARVYDSHERMLAARHLAKAKDSPAWIGPRVVSLEVGSRVCLWDADWKVLHRNEQHLVIQSEEPEQRLLTLPIDDVETLLRTGALASETCGLVDEIRREREERFLRASPEALAAAEHRWECVQYFLKHGKPPQGVDERSVRRYFEWMREAERDLGVGFAGLIRRRGRNPQLPDPDDPTERLLAQVVAEFSDPKAIKGTPKAKRVPALASARIACGRRRALTSLDSPNPSTACLGTESLACVKMNPGILIGAQSPAPWVGKTDFILMGYYDAE